MADKYCEACSTLQEDAPDFIQNGVTSSIDTRLRNDHGFSAKSSVDTDCEALNLANDCLIGFMADEAEAYDVCDWKTWAQRFATNVHNVIDASISSICGLWTKVHNLLSRVSALEDAQSDVCDVLSGVTDLVVGKPQSHTMTTISGQLGYREQGVTGRFYTMAEKKKVTVCDEEVDLQGLSAIYDGPELFFINPPIYGMVLARISYNDLVPTYMDDSTFNSLVVAGEDFFQLYGYNPGRNDGVIIQTRLGGDSNYPNQLVIRIRAIINGQNIVTGQNLSDNPTFFNRSTPPVHWTKTN